MIIESVMNHITRIVLLLSLCLLVSCTPSEKKSDSDLEPEPEPSPTLQQGISYRYFELTVAQKAAKTTTGLAYALQNYQLVKQGNITNILLDNRDHNDYYAFEFTGSINIETEADYTFYLTSQGVATFTIDNEVIINNEAAEQLNENQYQVKLSVGQHVFSLEYFNDEQTGSLELAYASDELAMAKEKIPDSILYTPVVEKVLVEAISSPPLNRVSGLNYQYFEAEQSQLANLDELMPIETGFVDALTLTLNKRETDYAIKYQGYISIPRDDDYTFYVSSSGLSQLAIDDIAIGADNTAQKTTSQKITEQKATLKTKTLFLQAGLHRFILIHAPQGDLDNIYYNISAPNLPYQGFPAQWFTREVDNMDDTDGDGVIDELDFYPLDSSRYLLENIEDLTVTFDDTAAQLSLSLSWQAVTMDDTLVTGYNLYRSLFDEDNYQLIASVDKITNQYIDSEVENKNAYKYIIKSHTEFNKESESSNQTQAYVAYNNNVVAIGSLVQQNNALLLSWDTSVADNTLIFKGDSAQQLTLFGSSISTSTSDSFTDSQITLGKTYYYQLQNRQHFINPITGDEFNLDGPLSAIGSLYLTPYFALQLNAPQIADKQYQLVVAAGVSHVAVSGGHLNNEFPVNMTFSTTGKDNGGKPIADITLQTSGDFSVNVPLTSTNLWSITSQSQGVSDAVSLAIVVDDKPPTLTVEGVLAFTTTESTLTIKGNVSDENGLKSLVVVSNFYTQPFSVDLLASNNGQFSVDIPLKEGVNTLTVIATDKVDLQTTVVVTVTKKTIEAPKITITSHNSGGIVSRDKVTVVGELYSESPLSSLSISMGEKSSTLTLLRENTYHFEFADITLQEGDNTLTFVANSSVGQGSATLVLTYQKAVDNLPEITILSHSAGQVVSSDKVTIVGELYSESPLSSLSISMGEKSSTLTLLSENTYHFEFADITLQEGDNTLTFVANSSVGQGSATLVLTYQKAIDNLPKITILSHSAGQVVNSDIVTITGELQSESPLSSLSIALGQQSGELTLLRENIYRFEFIDIALQGGENTLTFVANSSVGQSSATLVLTYQKAVDNLPTITITSHSSGQVVSRDIVTITGELYSESPLSTLSIAMGQQGSPLTLLRENTYGFEFVDITLQAGDNSFVFVANSSAGQSSATLALTYQKTVKNIPPKIIVTNPQVGSILSGESFVLEGDIVSPTPIVEFSINGESVFVDLIEDERYHFTYVIEFTGATLTLVLKAKAENGEEDEQIITYSRDDTRPVISLTNNILASPAVNIIIQQPYQITGVVNDNNLSSLTLNDTVVDLVPSAGNNEYSFSVDVNIPSEAQTSFELTAYDLANNTSSLSFILLSKAKASIDIIAPSGLTDFISQKSTFTLQVLARIKGLQSGDKARLNVDNAAPIMVEVNNTLLNSAIDINSEAGEHSVTVEVVGSAGQIVATSKQVFTLVNPASIALQTVKTVPSNGFSGAEPHQAIEVYFNQAIDPSLLTIEVRETVNGKTYINSDAPGTSFLNAKGYQLVDIARANEQVPGAVSLLPGNNVVAFYPTRDLAYGANVFVSVSYNAKALSRFSYQVRALPTQLTGAVLDQLNQPVAGIKVELPALGRATTTDAEGVFNFGAGDLATKTLKAGVYQLIINRDFANPLFGITEHQVAIEQGRHTQLGRITLPMIDKNTPFTPLSSGQTHTLAQGELILDVSQGQLTFPDGRHTGVAQITYTDVGSADVLPSSKAFPLGLYAIQPAGIKTTGTVSLSIKLLKIYNSYDYVPANGTYVVLVGRKGSSNALQPIGVGQIDGYTIHSVGKLNITRLDFIGYAFVLDNKQEALQQYAEGQSSIEALIGAL